MKIWRRESGRAFLIEGTALPRYRAMTCTQGSWRDRFRRVGEIDPEAVGSHRILSRGMTWLSLYFGRIACCGGQMGGEEQRRQVSR